MRRFLAAATWGALLALIVGASALAAVGDLGEQRRISTTGPDGNISYSAGQAEVAHNADRDEYLAVWTADTSADGEDEIFARVLGPGGEPVSEQLQISSMGPDGDAAYAGRSPSVTYNAAADEYLVAWGGSDNPPLARNEYEIFVQRIGPDGAQLGTDDQRISTMGPDGNTAYGAGEPVVAYNPAANEYLVAWTGRDDRFQLQANEHEIFVQRLSANGAEIGADDARISTAGPFQDGDFGAFAPAVVHNSIANEYLIVWYADDESPAQVDDDYELFAQRLSAAGNEIGADDQRISSMGPDRDAGYGAYDPDVTHNPVANEYLVAWSGGEPPMAPDEWDIFAQRLAADGAELGLDDQRISVMGPDGDPQLTGAYASLAYDASANEYLVSWGGNDETPALAGAEVLAQRLSATGNEVGPENQRISAMGPDGDTRYSGHQPGVAYSPKSASYVFVWGGSTDTPPLAPFESEIYSRSMDAPDPPGVTAPDTTLEGAAIDLAKKLRIKGKELKIKLDAGCAEACTAAAAGAVAVKPAKGKLAAKAKRLKLAPATASIAAGQTTKLTLKLKGSKAKRKKLTRKLVGAIRRGAKAKASIAVTLTDAAGNAAVVDDAAKLKAK